MHVVQVVYYVYLVDHSARVGCSTFCCATPCWREPTSSKQLSTVAAFCWFSVWSLSCRCRVKFSTQSSLAEIWVSYIFGWLDLLQILRMLAAFSLCGPLLIIYLQHFRCRLLRGPFFIVCYFSTTASRVTSPSWGAPPPCKQDHELITKTKLNSLNVYDVIHRSGCYWNTNLQ